MNTDLRALIEHETRRAVTAPAQAAAEALRAHYGSNVRAVVFYGSCLRDDDPDGLLDFYVLVDRYRPALGVLGAFFAACLPPNVYSHEFPTAGRIIRAKVAVMAWRPFMRGLTGRAFASTLSARFAQPAAIVFARDDRTIAELIGGFCGAVHTTIARTMPLMPARFTGRDLWRRAFAESFGAELRPETAARREAIVTRDRARYEAVTAAVLGGPCADGTFVNHAAGRGGRTRLLWRLRRIHGKTLNAARLIKAAFTFGGGLDYAAWKIGRHSGVRIALTAADRARPLIAGTRLFFLALRRGGLR
jgi:hypothetical protein